MTWLALLAALQETRWDFTAGSWVELNVLSLRSETSTPRVFRDDFPPVPRPRRKAFAEGLAEVARRDDVWRGRPCAVVEYRSATTQARAWVVEGLRIPARELDGTQLPGDVVKAERVERVGGAELILTLEVLDLQARIDAAGRSFACVLETSTSVIHTANGSRCLRSRRRWLSAEVPGHVVLQYRQCTSDPAAAPHAYDTRDELRAFHVAR